MKLTSRLLATSTITLPLSQRFEVIAESPRFHVSDLVVKRRYRVLRAGRATTAEYGQTVELTLLDGSMSIHLYLPPKYGAVFIDDDFTIIGTPGVRYYLTSKGKVGQTYFLTLNK
jgi:hypothetical protein